MQPYRIAESFFGFNLAFSILFVIIAAAISILAFHIYRLTKKRQLKLFGFSFAAFALANLGMLVAELVRRFAIESGIAFHGKPPLPFWPVIMAATFTVYMFGLVMLTYTTVKVKDVRIPLMLGAVITAALLIDRHPVMLFHLFATILLFFLAWYYLKNYLKHWNVNNLLVVLAFGFLLLGNLILIFSVNGVMFFTAGRVLQLIGYCCFLANLVLVFRK